MAMGESRLVQVLLDCLYLWGPAAHFCCESLGFRHGRFQGYLEGVGNKQEASGPELSLKLLFFCAQEPLTDTERMK